MVDCAFFTGFNKDLTVEGGGQLLPRGGHQGHAHRADLWTQGVPGSKTGILLPGKRVVPVRQKLPKRLGQHLKYYLRPIKMALLLNERI